MTKQPPYRLDADMEPEQVAARYDADITEPPPWPQKPCPSVKWVQGRMLRCVNVGGCDANGEGSNHHYRPAQNAHSGQS